MAHEFIFSSAARAGVFRSPKERIAAFNTKTVAARVVIAAVIAPVFWRPILSHPLNLHIGRIT